MTMFDDPRMAAALTTLTTQLAEESPEAAEILEKLRDGYTSEVEAMRQLMAIPGINEKMERIAGGAFAALRDDTGDPESNYPAILGVGDIPMTGEGPPVVVQETGLPRLNPLIEAAIAERASVDGDVPELRSGPLPEGAQPAVPVESDVRDPVALGAMLQTASEQVAGEMAEATQEHMESARKLLAATEEQGLDEDAALALYKDNLPAPLTGVPGYAAGQVPALRKVEKPVGSVLAAMPVEEQQQAAYKAMGTSQGRRSATGVVLELVQVGLSSEGFEFASQGRSAGAEVMAHAVWSVQMSGPLATQSNFSFIDTAAKALLLKLVPLLKENGITDGMLEVEEVSQADVQTVGWAARVVGR